MRLKPIFIFLMTGVIFMLNARAFAANLNYEKFISKNPEVDCALDYISGWSYVEQSGPQGSYEQVGFYSPGRKNNISLAGVILTIEKNSPARPVDLDAFARGLLYKRMRFQEARTLSEASINLCGAQAKDIQLSYKRLKRLYSANPELTTIKERIIILQKDNKFYTLRYENEENKFNDFKEAFNYIIGTLSFKE